MAKITRTIRLRGSKTMTGFVFFLTAVFFFVIGWMKEAKALTWVAVAICTLLTLLSLVRRRTVVTLDDKGIRYKSPFWDLHFLWHDVRACGVYYVRNREVYPHQPGQGDLMLHEKWPLTIFVSTRMHYFPQRQNRFINRSCIHFRWNHEAWSVIAQNVSGECRKA